MSKLVDVEDVRQCVLHGLKHGWSLSDFAQSMDEWSSFIELVHCKDCAYSCPFTEEELKYPFRVGEWHCEFWQAEMHEDDYCSCGKRSKYETDSQE